MTSSYPGHRHSIGLTRREALQIGYSGLLGIGLSICQAIIDEMNGRIWAESAGVGQGARFGILLRWAKEDSGDKTIPVRPPQTLP